MSTATFSPVHGGRPSGATAATSGPHRHPIGNALRAVKVFAAAAVRVVVMGEFAEDAGVARR
ncbi:hypothetical protein [Streptomyces toxytricini]|uniref:hypothetical protein n=1 Tax=Streptomyces toxytricini TaxID=67369 RepID=UPI00341A10D0